MFNLVGGFLFWISNFQQIFKFPPNFAKFHRARARRLLRCLVFVCIFVQVSAKQNRIYCQNVSNVETELALFAESLEFYALVILRSKTGSRHVRFPPTVFHNLKFKSPYDILELRH
jgi:hypothetical protein